MERKVALVIHTPKTSPTRMCSRMTPGTVPARLSRVKVCSRLTKTGCCGKAFGMRKRNMIRPPNGMRYFARA